MEIKFVILLLVATATQSSVALNSSNSCVPLSPLTNIEADLAVIQFGQVISLDGLAREVEIIFTLIKTLIAEKAGEIYVNPKYAELRFARAQNEALTAATVPIIPLLEGIRTVQPEINMKSTSQRTTAIITSLVNRYFLGIKLAEEKDYSKALAAIQETEEKALADGDSFVNSVFDTLLKGTVDIPHEAKPSIYCVHAKAASAFRNGSSGIFDGIILLLKVNVRQTKAELNDYICQIERAFSKTIDGFTGEVANKIAAIRNLRTAAFMEITGMVTGLFALDATRFKICV